MRGAKRLRPSGGPRWSMLRRWGEGHERMWVGFLRIQHPGLVREYPVVHPREGRGHEGSAQPMRRYVTGSNTLQVTPTPRELAFAAVTSRRQPTEGSFL